MLLKLIKNKAFDPEQIQIMADAYEAARCKLGLVTREDQLTELLASTIIGLAQQESMTDANVLCDRALAKLGVPAKR